jgi:hypothetical protein
LEKKKVVEVKLRILKIFRIKTIQHLERLESMIASNSITTSQIKKSVQILIKTLDLQSQTEYQEFLNNLE